MLVEFPLTPLTLSVEVKPTGLASGMAVFSVAVKLVESARLVSATSSNSRIPNCFFIITFTGGLFTPSVPHCSTIKPSN